MNEKKFSKALKQIEAKNWNKAIDILRPLVKKHPEHYDACQILGAAYLSAGNFNQAIQFFEKAIQLDPTQAGAFANYSLALQNVGRLKNALKAISSAVDIDPGNEYYSQTKVNLLQLLGDQEAATSLMQSLCDASPTAANLTKLGKIHRLAGNNDLAIDCLDRSLKANPTLLDAALEKALCLRSANEPRRALDLYLEFYSPDAASVLVQNIASTMLEVTDEQTFREYCEIVFKRGIGFTETTRDLWLSAWQPPMFESADHVQDWRQRYSKMLDQLLATTSKPQKPEFWYPTHNFYIAYQGRDNLQLHQKLSQLTKQSLALPEAQARFSGQSNKIRIGFFSEFFYEGHTINKLYRGIVAQLDRSKFEVHAFAILPPNDVVRAFGNIAGAADQFTFLERDIDHAAQTIQQQELDCLFFANVGMSEFGYLLAHLRLARIQMTSWGHPDTTGIETIDYFLSSTNLEPDGSAEKYSETLLLTKQLPCFYYQEDILQSLDQHADDLQLPTGSLVACPQSLFKIQPEFDAIIVEILRQNPATTLLLLGDDQIRREALVARLVSNGLEDTAQVHFLPAMQRTEFLAMLKACQVIIDPMLFGGGNTTYEALAIGTPIVTFPGGHMRARVTYAAYQQMEIDDCIASDNKSYIALTSRLLQDSEFRDSISQKILSRSNLLFETDEAVREIEEVLEGIVVNERVN